MARNGRAKGKRGELEFAHLLEGLGCEARRGVQYSGGADSPDVVCPSIPSVHFEVKRTEKFYLYKALEQAMNDAGDKKLPIVVHRQNGQQWVAVMNVTDLMTLLKDAGRVTPAPEPEIELEFE